LWIGIRKLEVSRKLIQPTTSVKKLQTLVIKLDVQLKNELRIVNRIKTIIFKSLERNIIALANASKGFESVKGPMD
jgi:hypothetical protein